MTPHDFHPHECEYPTMREKNVLPGGADRMISAAAHVPGALTSP
jgi:hypothetical protein